MILPIGAAGGKRIRRKPEEDAGEEKQPRRKRSLKSIAGRKTANSRLKPKPQPKADDADDEYVYDTSHGYPKGIDGVRLKVRIRGKDYTIKGVRYEDMDKDTQKSLDERPLDDAGKIRVFVPDEIMGIVEFGSSEHAQQFKDSLSRNGDRLL